MLSRLYAKNVKGIKYGLGKNELEINFLNYFGKEHIIALLGDNGRGKSTILDLCHPYRQTFLKDTSSFTDIFINGTGEVVREYILNNNHYVFGIISNKKLQKCYITKNNKPLLVKDSVVEYDDMVWHIFGNPDTFFKTYFRGGKNSYLSNMKESGQRLHFLNILGFATFYQYREEARLESKKISEILYYINTEVDRLKEEYDNFNEKEYKSDIKERQDTLLSMDSEIKTIEKEIYNIEQERKNYNKLSNEHISIENDILKYKTELETISKDIAILKKTNINLEVDKIAKEKEIDTLTTNIQERETVKTQVELKKKLTTELSELEESAFKFKSETEKYSRLIEEIDLAETTLSNINIELESSVGLSSKDFCAICTKNAEILLNKLDNKYTSLQHEYDRLFASQKSKISESDIIWEDIKVFKSSKEKYDAIKQQLKDIPENIDTVLEGLLNKHISALATHGKKQLELSLTIDNNNNIIKEKELRKTEYTDILENLVSKNLSIIEELEKITINSDELERDLQELLTAKDELTALITKLIIKLDEFKKAKIRLNKLIKDQQQSEIEKNEWDLLEEVFNTKNGMPILLLKEVLPFIENEANILLQDIYKDFRVVFNTTKINSKKEDIFSFNIVIERKNTAELTPLEMLSEGEKAMVEAAIALASIIYTQSTAATKLSMMFLDECDGSLSLNNTENYYKMIDKAHERAGCKQTIFITHKLDSLPSVNKIELDPKAEKGYRIESNI